MNRPVSPLLAEREIAFDPHRPAADAVAEFAFARGAELDQDGAFPTAEVEALHRGGLLAAPLPRRFGGIDPDAATLAGWLSRIGAGSLPLGRLYEGHVNALGLVARYGAPAQIEVFARAASEGELLGVWNTDDGEGLHLDANGDGFMLRGRKILCSGAGYILRPLVTANDAGGRRVLVAPRLAPGARADLSRWTAQGMRASATGTVDFTGLWVSADEIIGADGDYERQPTFSGGAWRFCAVQLGGLQRLFELLRQHLCKTGRGGDPHQAARLGEAGIAIETARLWVMRAGAMAHDDPDLREPESIVAYVNLARLAVERAGLDVMEIVHRSVGLQSFVRPNPIERVARDLATYLRQPAPDRALTNAAAFLLSGPDLWR